DLERDDVVEEGHGDGHPDEEDHGRAVHREELIVQLRPDQVGVGDGELEADEQCLESADQQEEERGGTVQDADALVVYRRDPAPDSAAVGRGGPERRGFCSRHGSGSLVSVLPAAGRDPGPARGERARRAATPTAAGEHYFRLSRYAATARTSSSESPVAGKPFGAAVCVPGISTPGLRSCGSLIQAITFSSVFGRAPAPTAQREP